MRKRILAFLDDLDRALTAHADGEVMEVYLIGRSALLMEHESGVTTSDVDILRPKGSPRLVELATEEFGKGRPKARPHGLYLEVVEEAYPPVPAGYEKRASRVDGGWEVLRVYRLDPHDLAATKLRRFAGKDREDIRTLCDLGRLGAEKLEETLEKAYRFCHEKDGDEFRDAAFRHLRVVQSYLRGEIREF